MARSHGRLLARIWSDDDFRALPVDAQQLYALLISQPNLSHAGTISITVRRWAGMSVDATTESVLAALRVLSDRRFVVVEWDTEELLVRTLVRNDGVFKQPKVLRAAKADALAVASPKIRAALAAELRRCPIEDVSANARDDVSVLLTEMVEALGSPPDGPDGGVSDTHTDTPGDGSPEAMPRGIENPPRSARGGSPALSPTPTPSPTASGGAALAPLDDPAKWLTDRHYNRMGTVISWPATRGIVRKFLAAGRDPTAIDEALQRIADEGRSLTLETLRIELDGLPQRRRPGPPTDGYSDNTRAHLALVDEIRSEVRQGEIA
jgi:hypothetical protein